MRSSLRIYSETKETERNKSGRDERGRQSVICERNPPQAVRIANVDDETGTVPPDLKWNSYDDSGAQMP